jgi:hypothetical protein
MMEAERTTETLVNVYQTTRRYNPEDSHLRTVFYSNFKESASGNFPVTLALIIWNNIVGKVRICN